MPETNMESQQNQVFNCQCDDCHCPITGGSGDLQSNMMTSGRDLSHMQSSRRSNASMRAFTSFMLNAWRQRREEVRDLQQVVEGLQNSSMKAKNKLHVLNTVMRVEQKRNSELQLQLRQSHLSIDKARTSCECLTSSLQSLSAEKNQLHLELDKSRKELNELEEISGQTKKELFGALSEQRNLQSQLSQEQRSRHQLQLEKEELLKKVVLEDSKKAQYQKAQECYRRELAEKEASIQALRTALEEKNRNGKEQTAELEKIKAQITELCHKNSRSNFFSFCSESIGRLNISPRQSQEVTSVQRISIWQKFHQFSTNLMYLFSMYLRPGVHLSRRRRQT